jgi:hypothetical protein
MNLSRLAKLKLEIWSRGIQVSADARSQLSRQGRNPVTLADYASTSGIPLRLGDDIWVNAPIRECNSNFVPENAPFILDFDLSARFVLRGLGFAEYVLPAFVPDYYCERNEIGVPYTSFGLTHTDRVRVNPIGGCALACKFCDIPYRLKYRKENLHDLLRTTELALTDPVQPAYHILLSGGTPAVEDYKWLKTVYQAFTNHFAENVPIDIMMTPNPGLLDPHELKYIGIDGVFPNLELWNERSRRHFMLGKYNIGRDSYLRFISSAVPVFGRGKVRSLILVGLEPLEDTLRAVEAVSERGADPILSPFRPSPLSPLHGNFPPLPQFLREAYLRSREIVEKYGVKLGPRCIPCQHNTLTFPDGSTDYFSHEDICQSLNRVQHAAS